MPKWIVGVSKQLKSEVFLSSLSNVIVYKLTLLLTSTNSSGNKYVSDGITLLWKLTVMVILLNGLL